MIETSGHVVPRQCRRDSRALGTPKKAYATRAEAEAAINGGAGMNAYKCGNCEQWHVGHLPGTRYGDKPDGRRIGRTPVR